MNFTLVEVAKLWLKAQSTWNVEYKVYVKCKRKNRNFFKVINRKQLSKSVFLRISRKV